MAKRSSKAATVGVVALAVGLVALTPAASARTLDSVELKAKPDKIQTKIAAVSSASGKIYITLSVQEKGERKYKEVARDTATGVHVGDGAVTIEAGQSGASYEKNGGEGLLSVGNVFAQYFTWNAKREKISFYGVGETPS